MTNYQASDIQVLEGLDAVRCVRACISAPPMCAGCIIFCGKSWTNAIDEAIMGYADQVSVTLQKNGCAVVEDNGRGVPTDIHPTLGISGVEVVYTQLHAGGKFNQKVYTYSGVCMASRFGCQCAVILHDYRRLSGWTHYRQEFHSYLMQIKIK